MTERIILTIISILMLFLTIQSKDKWSVLITGGLTLGIIITWTRIPIIITSGMIIYTISALLGFIYGIMHKELNKLDRLLIALAGLSAFTANLFALQNWPYGAEIRMAMLIPLIGYFVLLTNGLLQKNELGFMTILNMHFLLQFLGLWS